MRNRRSIDVAYDLGSGALEIQLAEPKSLVADILDEVTYRILCDWDAGVFYGSAHELKYVFF